MSASCTDACSRFSSAEELAEFLDGLHEMTPDGAITGRKWSVAQRARDAVLAATPPRGAPNTLKVRDAIHGDIDVTKVFPADVIAEERDLNSLQEAEAASAAPLTAEDIRRIIREELAASRPEWRGGPR